MRAAVASAAGVPTPAELREAVDIIRAEKLPETADGREKYFASNLSTAEQLGLQSESPVNTPPLERSCCFPGAFSRQDPARGDMPVPRNTCISSASRTDDRSRAKLPPGRLQGRYGDDDA
jgi:hypothetical protein